MQIFDSRSIQQPSAHVHENELHTKTQVSKSQCFKSV